MQSIQSRQKEVVLILVSGFVIREAFSFWTGHPFDFELWVRLGYSIAHGSNPYVPIPPAPGLSFADVGSLHDKPVLAYLPLWPMITDLMYEVYALTGSANRFVYYFLLKQPIILGDMSLGYLLYRYVLSRKSENAIWALRFWIFSPFIIIVSAVWGMFDSIAMCFVMLSIVVASDVKSSFCEGMAILAKSIPIVYAIPLAFRGPRSWRRIAIAVTLPAALTLLVITAMGWPLSPAAGTLASTATKGGESMSAWDTFFYLAYLGIVPSFNPVVYEILGLLWVPMLLLFTLVVWKKFQFKSDWGLVQSLLVLTLAFLLFKARITEQYAIYLFALAGLDVALWNSERKQILFATTLVAMVYLFTNNYFLIRFLSPIMPQYTAFEFHINALIGGVRLAVNLLLGIAFTCLNVVYLAKVLRASPQVFVNQ
jgi:Gpi18-like mannosyltransferase